MQAPLVTQTSSPPFVRRWTVRRVILATLAVVAVVFGFYLIYRFSTVFFVLFVAAVLATAIRPAVLWLEQRRVPQWAGVLSIYLALALVTAGVFAVLVPILIDQGAEMAKKVPGYYVDIREQLRESNNLIVRRVGNNLPEKPALSMLGGTTRQQVTGTGDEQSVVSQAAGYLRSFSWGLFGVIAVFLIAYFWTLDREQIVRAGLLIVPITSRAGAQEIWDSAEQKVGAYVRGQALLMLAIGVLSAIAFLLIGLPSALLLAVLAGLLEAIPYAGPILTAVVVVLLTAAQAPDKIWWAIGATGAIQVMENVVLVPRIMGRTVGVNPFVTLLAIAAFGTLLGFLGAILAIPLAAIIQVLLDHWVLHRDRQPAVEIEGRDKAAVVRYYAQDLAQDLRERIRATPSDQDEDDDSFEERAEAIVGQIDELLVQISASPAPQTTPIPEGRRP